MHTFEIEDFDKKNLKVRLNGDLLFFKVKKVIKITLTHVIFIDATGKQKGLNLSTIEEIY